jgi:hypothetical protein
LRILVHYSSKADLPQVTGALHTQGSSVNLEYGRKEQRCENSENAEYDD